MSCLNWFLNARFFLQDEGIEGDFNEDAQDEDSDRETDGKGINFDLDIW